MRSNVSISTINRALYINKIISERIKNSSLNSDVLCKHIYCFTDEYGLRCPPTQNKADYLYISLSSLSLSEYIKCHCIKSYSFLKIEISHESLIIIMCHTVIIMYQLVQ